MLVFDYYAEFLSLKGYFTRKNFKIGFKKIHNIGKYFEKEMIFQSARVQGGELIILGKLPKSKSDVSEQVSHSSPS